jgi:putative membrane-bound dehydrogenase-like protein
MMTYKSWTFLLSLTFINLFPLLSKDKIKALIIDGRNNHDWQVTTQSLIGTLNDANIFNLGVSSAPPWLFKDRPLKPRKANPEQLKVYKQALKLHQNQSKEYAKTLEGAWSHWNPKFSDYDVVVLNYNGPSWPQTMQNDFLKFVENGGGVVLIHAANNAFANWDAFNVMIGIGWRKSGFGQCIKIDSTTGQPVHENCDNGSGHGSKHPFQITVREPNHPIMKNIPPIWMHGKDELYHRMRGPAQNLKVLSSAYSDPKQRGTGQHEPITWEVTYGKGRVIVTSMGHFWRGQTEYDSLNCVGFQTIFSRSVEYAATGKVSLPVPKDFPSSDKVSLRAPNKNAALVARARKAENPYSLLTPEQELSTFELPEGYIAELVAAEPQIQEPVLTVWDGNGAMYVAEMRSYMQDADGTGTKTLKNGRVKKLIDKDGDGVYETASIFVDNLNLPRMVLPLDDWIAIRETDSYNVIAYRDTDGDGVSDEQKVLYAPDPKGRNFKGKSVEHQDSGLIWNIDNYIYISYNRERYRFTNGVWEVEPQPSHWTQWGLTHDDTGHLYWVHNSGPLVAAQIHPKYWKTVHRLAQKGINGLPVDLGDAYDSSFMKVQSRVLLNDRGGSASETRGFTSACGQSVFRGTALHKSDYGDYFVCDPTIHVVRQANIVREHGKIKLIKSHSGDSEFLRSSDINSRFVNTATGPDGCLYVTDMYRGIIQDAPWMNPKARAFTRESGLANHRQHGRIWRIRHKNATLTKTPQLLKTKTIDLVDYLKNKNGWVRDTAQKLIILREDRDLAEPALRTLLESGPSLARVHALWTLEGMKKINIDLLKTLTKETDPKLRLAIVKVAESALETDTKFQLYQTMQNEKDPQVAQQLIFSLGRLNQQERLELIQNMARYHLGDRGVMLATTVSLWGMNDLPLIKNIKQSTAFAYLKPTDQYRANADWQSSLGNWDRGLKFPDSFNKEDQRFISNGEKQYYKSCATCHGADGRGTKVPGSQFYMAPSLYRSPRVQGSKHQLIPILINGLVGPLDGKSYQAGYMAPAHTLGITRDDRLAELLSYIRFAWGQEGSMITKEEVYKLRKQHQTRTAPWTQSELEKLLP